MSTSKSSLDPKWPILILAIGINSFIISIFFPSPVVRVIAGSSAVLLFVMLTGYLVGIFSDDEKSLDIGSIPDTIRMTLQYIKFNRKYILSSVIGLIVAILVISQSMVMMTSYQQHAFESFTSGSDMTMISVDVDHVNHTYHEKYSSFVQDNIYNWANNRGITVSDVYSYQTLEVDYILGVNTDFTKYVDTFTMTTREWNYHTYSILKQLPSFPGFEFNKSESVMFLPNTITKAAPEFGYIEYQADSGTDFVNGSYQLEFHLGDDRKPVNETSEPFTNVSTSVDRIWKWTLDDLSYLRENQVQFPESLLDGTFFSPSNKITEIRNKLIAETHENGYVANSWGERGFEVKVYTDVPRLDEMSLTDYRQRVDDLSSLFYDKSFDVINDMVVIKYPNRFAAYSVKFSISSPLEFVLDDFLEHDNNFQSLMQFSITPLVLISLFLFYFSLSIVESRKLRYFKKLRGRGLSSSQSTFIISGEILSYAILSPLVVLPLVRPIGTYLLSGNLIEQTTIPLTTPVNLANQIILLSLLFAIDFNLPFILNVLKSDLDMNQIQDSDDQSILERGNYDLILLFLAAVYWITVPFFSVPTGLEELFYEHLGYVALALTLIASPIFVSRFLIGKLDSLFSFVEQSDATQVAIRSIQLNRRFTRKVITLLIIATMFTYIGIVSSTTLSEVNDELTHYQIGSDMYVEGMEPRDTEYWESLDHESIENFAHISRFTYQPNSIELRPGERHEDAVTYEFLGVDTTTLAKVIYWQDSYANQSLQSLLDAVREEPNIAMQTNTAKALDLDIGETFQFLYGYQSSLNYSLDLSATFNFFPRLVTEVLGDDNVTENRVDTVQILTSNEVVHDLSNKASRRPYNGALIKLKDGANRDELRDYFYQQLSDLNYVRVQTDVHNRVSMFNAGGSAGSFSPLAEFEEQFFQSSLNLLLITSIMVTLMGMGYYSFVTMTQRREEIGMFRALGMVSDQIFKHLLIEILLLVLTSIVFSGLVGSYISGKIFRIMTGNIVQTIPPFVVRLPVFRIVGFTLLMVASAILITVYPSYKLARGQTGNILR